MSEVVFCSCDDPKPEWVEVIRDSKVNHKNMKCINCNLSYVAAVAKHVRAVNKEKQEKNS